MSALGAIGLRRGECRRARTAAQGVSLIAVLIAALIALTVLLFGLLALTTEGQATVGAAAQVRWIFPATGDRR